MFDYQTYLEIIDQLSWSFKIEKYRTHPGDGTAVCMHEHAIFRIHNVGH